MSAFQSPPPLRLDEQRRDVCRGDHPLGLTPREFQLLAALMARPHTVVTSEELLQAMWGTSTVGGDHPVHVYISRLRAKLTHSENAVQVIVTIRGIGYMYAPHSPEPQIVRLVYDRHLTLRVIEPNDRPFLGWEPEDVIGTFFLLTADARVHSSRRIALAIAKVRAAIGLDGQSGPQMVRCADGTERSAMTELTILTRSRRFLGLEATLWL